MAPIKLTVPVESPFGFLIPLLAKNSYWHKSASYP